MLEVLVVLLTVGIISSWNEPVVSTLTNELLPAFCKPINDSSISLLKNKLQQHPGSDKRKRCMSVSVEHGYFKLHAMHVGAERACLLTITCEASPAGYATS